LDEFLLYSAIHSELSETGARPRLLQNWFSGPKGRQLLGPAVRPGNGSEYKPSAEGYAIVPPQQVKIAQPGIVQYVAPPNMLWYAPYCTIEGATGFVCVISVAPVRAPSLLDPHRGLRAPGPPSLRASPRLRSSAPPGQPYLIPRNSLNPQNTNARRNGGAFSSRTAIGGGLPQFVMRR